MPLTLTDKLQQIISQANEATTGPWRAGGDEGWPIGSFSTGNSGIDGKDYTVWTVPMHGSELGDVDAKTDAEFIASSRVLVPALARALGVAVKALERVEGMCDVGPTCACGRPNGLPAVVSCAKGNLAEITKILLPEENADV